MIEYVEVRSVSTRELIGIVDTAKSVIWKTVYYGVGEFEIYAPATAKVLSILKSGNLVTRPNDINVGIISNIEISDNAQDGKMIVARGNFAKIILNRRIIYKFISSYSVSPYILSGNVAEACWRLINANCGTTAPVNRRFSRFGRGNVNDLPAIIVDDNGKAAEKQVTYSNLLEYTDGLLQEYKYGAYVWLDTMTKDYLYVMYSGKDRSIGNTSGNKPLIFSKEFDNLSSSSYIYSADNLRTTAIIGGEGEGSARFVTRKNDTVKGYDRRELFIDGSSIAKTVTEGETETTYTDAQYSAMLEQQANEDLENYRRVEEFTGSIDLTNSRLKFGFSSTDDYYVGDLITIEDKSIGKTANVRILSVTEVQDESGYNIDIEYGMDGDNNE